ncbi:acetyl-CoA carboxylase biotin carboxyl carrier protein subunit [Marivirga sp. S37H4]|uniref:Acetyl-CoA carboxylase biotin carboxyl carrier protein subunit n=1 Tax=Marivirga aurantiaca TaxID=2802615 RepID=A0A934X1E3_9BACT|nr:acetyl-CoA carboxylase biotin carboxyl carrier protein subunit [Marivirga aurantiaca]MBK6267198.1 acetyl-CoA carboxylase biotin carboxyl carrier protein subunit [Marivirga aurantiaca]
MYKVNISNVEEEVSVLLKENDIFINNEPFNWDIYPIDKNSFHIIYKNKSLTAYVISVDYVSKEFVLQINGKIIELSLKDKMDILLEELGMSDLAKTQINEVKAPMPGLISEILVKEGDEVKEGDSLLILEAMKMENVIKSPGEGKISEIKIQKGNSVEKNQILIQF